MATNTLEALSAQQVNSWPIKTPPTTTAGEPLAFFGSDDKAGFLQLAQERFRICSEATQKQREESETDTRFAAPGGEQWDTAIRNRRDAQKRPCLTINRIEEFIAHAVNSMRQQRPEIKVIAAADGADEDIATVEEGLLRHIQVNSFADVCYDEGFKDMCIGGLGWLRVVDDWAAPDSMDRELFIRRISNPFAVYVDPFCRQPDWSDMRYAFVVEDMTRGEFKARYGKDKEVASLENFGSIGDAAPFWFPGGKIRVAEYFHVEIKDDILCELEDKTCRLLSELPSKLYFVDKDTNGDLGLFMVTKEGDDWDPGEYVGRARKCKIPQVYWAKITALDILQERRWSGRYIPLIPIIGNQVEVDGNRIIAGMVRNAREPQRMYNYMYTSFVETIALVPKAPWIAEVNQIPDGALRDMWQHQADTPQSVLFYKQFVDEKNNLAPLPQRQIAEPPIAAFVQGLQMADQNLKSVFRIYDASLGQKGPQESGLAINARKVESDTGIYNWADNFIRSLRYLGTVLQDLLPAYYNTKGRIFRLVNSDTTMSKVTMNQPFEDEEGQMKHFDLEKGGNYQVVITTGPSYETKRQDAAQNMLNLFKEVPQLLASCADILVRELDFPGKDALADRIQKTLPPALRQPDANVKIPAEVQAQLSELSQQNQQLTAALHDATDKNIQATLRDQMKEEYATLREQMKQEVALAGAALKAGSTEAQFLAQKSFDELNYQRGLMERLLAQFQNPGSTSGAAPSSPQAPAQPSSAVPPTGSGPNPSVGGA